MSSEEEIELIVYDQEDSTIIEPETSAIPSTPVDSDGDAHTEVDPDEQDNQGRPSVEEETDD